ncbi:MAG: pyridoxamine 5'-phosphate oxidase family protein [Chloroflexi bacterium]|nr:pyridoxamine 5'-phosphate oxidase family protein [Chloroflexota bacterium]
MPRSLGSELPPHVSALLDGSELASRVGLTFLLLTTDAAGWPHVAMLSVGELLATEPSKIRAALWLSSSSSRNLERTGRAVLASVLDSAGYYVRVRAERLGDVDVGVDGRLAAFSFAIEDVQEDVVTYARLTSGITFELEQPERVLPRWGRTIAALRAI